MSFIAPHSYLSLPSLFFFFFFNDTATTEIYPLPLHDALPISAADHAPRRDCPRRAHGYLFRGERHRRSEEHTSELQSRSDLVCRLLLEKKNIPAELETAQAGHQPL